MYNNYRRLTGWLIPKAISEFEQSEDIERARTVGIVLLTSILLALIAFFFTLSHNSLPAAINSSIAQLSVSLLILNVVSLAIFIRSGLFAHIAHLVAATTYITYLISLGAADINHLSDWLIPLLSIPMLAAMIGGMSAGLIWGVVVAPTPFVVHYLWQVLLGVSPPINTSFTIAWLSPISTGALTIWFFGYHAGHMRRRLDAECARYAFDAGHDSLTEIPNRATFDRRLMEAIEQAERQHEIFVLVYIDLDNFKPINDTFGHQSGDEVLTVIAQRLKSVCRNSDTVARLGGDEFAILYRHLHSQDDSERCLKRVEAIFTAPVEIGNKSLEVAASIGAACYPSGADNAVDLKRMADEHMYEVKQRSRDSAL